MKRTEYRGRNEPLKSTPHTRRDGEMYARPKPNPFSNDWTDGYDDALAGIDGILNDRDPDDYWDGHRTGRLEREELDKSGSSNA